MKQQTLWTVATGAKQSRISQGTEPPLSSLPCIQIPNDLLESETGIHLMHTLPGTGIAHRHLSILFRASLVIYHAAWSRVKVVNRTMQILDLGENEWETYREDQQLGRGEEREKFEDASHKQKHRGEDRPGWQLQALWEHRQKHLA